MRALLNAMGVTLWGVIAITLAVALAMIGYRSAFNHKVTSAMDLRTAIPVGADIPRAAPSAIESRAPPSASSLRFPRAAPGAASARDQFHRAAANSQYAAVEQYGQQLFEDGQATPEDMALIGHFRYLQSDCANAAIWSERSVAAARSRGEHPPEDAYLVKSRCAPRVGASARMVAAPANVTSASSAPKDSRKISRVIAKQMTAAQNALQAQQWQEAIKNLDAAGQISGLNDYDQKTIHYLLGFADIKLGDMNAAQGEFEKAIATGAATSEEVAGMTKTLFAIAASMNQYQKTIDYGKQMVDAGTATTENLLMVSQSYFQLKDCKDAIGWADKGIASARKAGETPKENFYLFKLQCASDSQDNAAMAPVLVDLIKINNKTSYWNMLLRIERQEERDDHNTLMIYRVMYNTQSMKEDSDFIEMAQLLGDAALPGEAAAVLSKAMSSGAIKEEHKERTNRLLTALQSRADADNNGLPQEDAAASENAAGELSVKLGEVYYGFGDYQKAVDAINQGLQKGQIKHPDEAYVYLGLARQRLGDFTGAKQAFAGLKGVSNISPRMLRLWDLYAFGISAPLTAAR